MRHPLPFRSAGETVWISPYAIAMVRKNDDGVTAVALHNEIEDDDARTVATYQKARSRD